MQNEVNSIIHFDLTRYYHQYIVEFSEKCVTQNTATIYSPLIKNLQQVDLERDGDPDGTHTPYFEGYQPRIVAVVAGANSILSIACMLFERTQFSVALIGQMMLYPEKRKWKLMQISSLALLNELTIMPYILFSKTMGQMIKTLRCPEKGVRQIDRDDEDAKAWVDKSFESKKKDFELFWEQDLTDQVLRKQTKDKMGHTVWKLVVTNLGLAELFIIYKILKVCFRNISRPISRLV